jgi:hypothetical protein
MNTCKTCVSSEVMNSIALNVREILQKYNYIKCA